MNNSETLLRQMLINKGESFAMTRVQSFLF